MATQVAISCSSLGSNPLVAAPSDATKKIRVLGYVIVSAGTVNATFRSGLTTNKSGAFPLTAQAGVAASMIATGNTGWIETDVGEALNLYLSAAILVAGHLTYELV